MNGIGIKEELRQIWKDGESRNERSWEFIMDKGYIGQGQIGQTKEGE